MRTKEFKLDYSKPFGSMSDLYTSLGIFDALHEEMAKRQYKEGTTVNPNILKANENTRNKLIAAWEDNWRNYNYDRRSGKTKRPTLIRYKHPHPLADNDRQTIRWSFYFGIGPIQDDSLPDDVIVMNLDWDDEKDTRRGE